MISKTLLKKLPFNRVYVVYDSLDTYLLRKYNDESYHINVLGNRESMYIYEKDLENLIIEAKLSGDDDVEYYYKYRFKYNGYTRKYKTIAGIGSISVHQDFYGFGNLNFFSEYKDEDTIKELLRLKNTFKRKGKIRL
jgi:hypothetical protein